MRSAPESVRERSAGVIHNAVRVERYPWVDRPGDFFLALARICRDKGQGFAARLCAHRKQRLVIAGAVAGIGDPEQVARIVRSGRVDSYGDDMRYFAEEIAPFLDSDFVHYVGEVGGLQKMELIGNARALLFPIDWEEPFGMAMIESLACGTPVLAMRRGATAEVVTHGATGLLADNGDEFAALLNAVTQLDRMACRRSVEEKFACGAMADRYLRAYRHVVALDEGRLTPSLLPRDLHASVAHGDDPRRSERLDVAERDSVEPFGDGAIGDREGTAVVAR
jgi:glycosyltransferase involved in cell wall biosynthesis